jgi:hypothetical protein
LLRAGGAAVAIAFGVTWAGCARQTPAANPPATIEPAFVDVTDQAGFRHEHHKPTLDARLANIMSWVSSVGAAAAAGDYDHDGWMDLYVTDSEKGFPNHLYRNNGDGTFTDVAAEAGVADVNGELGVSMDCVWGDFDNDGWIDLYLVRWGRNSLFRNQGDGSFSEVTDAHFRRRDGAPGTDWANGNAAIFWDFDRDGRLDLYVGNYFRDVDLWNLETTRIMHSDFETARDGGRNFLFHQRPDGTFVEIAESLGLDDPGWTLAVGSADVNNDGWPDLYIANDFGPDRLFLNQGDGTLKNVSEKAIGVDTKKGMNVDFGDFNNDGWLDCYVANITTEEYLREGNMLWYNNGVDAGGEVSFLDVAAETDTYNGGWAWGAKFFDADCDGHLDIVGVNGFITAGDGDYWYDLASWTVLGKDPADAVNWPTIGDRSFSGREPTRFWHNTGQQSFVEKAGRVGLVSRGDGRGVVCLDYDNDGDLDLYLANQGQAPNFYRNDTPRGNHWLEVALVTDPTAAVNRDAIGARATVLTRTGLLIREREGGNGYCGHADPRLHFGLGKEDQVTLEVWWPDGGIQRLEDVAADQLLTVRQDPGAYSREPATKPTSPAARSRFVGGDVAKAEPAKPTIDPAEVDSFLSTLEKELRASLGPYSVSSSYRAFCADHGQHDRAIRFFEALVAARPSDSRARTELALAYIDKIPTCGGPAAIVSKGTLAKKSLDQLDRVVADGNATWVTYYARGMNHLYWPRALRHSDDAVADLTRCLELPFGDPDAPSDARAPLLRVHVGLGDAHAKAKRPEEARRAWERGLEAFSESTELKERLAKVGAGDLLAYVESQRSLEQRIDTDLSFLDPPAIP